LRQLKIITIGTTQSGSDKRNWQVSNVAYSDILPLIQELAKQTSACYRLFAVISKSR